MSTMHRINQGPSLNAHGETAVERQERRDLQKQKRILAAQRELQKKNGSSAPSFELPNSPAFVPKKKSNLTRQQLAQRTMDYAMAIDLQRALDSDDEEEEAPAFRDISSPTLVRKRTPSNSAAALLLHRNDPPVSNDDSPRNVRFDNEGTVRSPYKPVSAGRARRTATPYPKKRRSIDHQHASTNDEELSVTSHNNTPAAPSLHNTTGNSLLGLFSTSGILLVAYFVCFAVFSKVFEPIMAVVHTLVSIFILALLVAAHVNGFIKFGN